MDRRGPHGSGGGGGARGGFGGCPDRRPGRIPGRVAARGPVRGASERRARLTGLHQEVRHALARAQLADGAPEQAAHTASLALAASPADERAHQVLIEAYLAQGLHRLAVRQYHACRDALDAQLGVRPADRTEALHLAALDAPRTLLAGAARRTAGPPPVLPAAIRAPAPTPLRGRDEEVARLLDPAGPPVRLLAGEAGLGKTRLAGEAVRRAYAQGAVVLWGAGHDAEGHTPYGAFAEALDGWLAERPADERARAGAEYPELAALLPSLGRVAGEAAGWSPEEERDRLFRAARALLGGLAAGGRAVWVVQDDLHAADAGSFQLLSHLARRVGVEAGAGVGAEVRAGGSGVRGSGVPGARFLVTYRGEGMPASDPRRSGLGSLVREGVGCGGCAGAVGAGGVCGGGRGCGGGWWAGGAARVGWGWSRSSPRPWIPRFPGIRRRVRGWASVRSGPGVGAFVGESVVRH
ncbi:AAA family ATPase [Streptomyces sp. NPDC051561]|uniref:AAA family ATPase n=1 Tax=Streptomyces sp. NPDC051561 TaxID=3365658 RepID=UPI00379CDA12